MKMENGQILSDRMENYLKVGKENLLLSLK